RILEGFLRKYRAPARLDPRDQIRGIALLKSDGKAVELIGINVENHRRNRCRERHEMKVADDTDHRALLTFPVDGAANRKFGSLPVKFLHRRFVDDKRGRRVSGEIPAEGPAGDYFHIKSF